MSPFYQTTWFRIFRKIVVIILIITVTVKCSWYRVRALFKKCVRHSVCQRAVSARRALTGLSANHVRVKQHHVCQSANCCAVFAGKGFLPWYVFSFASRPIYLTPSQCPAPLPLNVPVYMPESVGIYVFNDIVNGNFNSSISNHSCSLSILISANHLPDASNYSCFRSHPVYDCPTCLSRFCQLTLPPSNNSGSWFLSNCPTCFLWFCQLAPLPSNNSGSCSMTKCSCLGLLQSFLNLYNVVLCIPKWADVF